MAACRQSLHLSYMHNKEKIWKEGTFFWECKYRKSKQCLFKIVTVIETAWWCVNKKTVKEFSNSKFKSKDGTFKITPKLFLSSNDIYGPNWGCLCELYDGCHDKE